VYAKRLAPNVDAASGTGGSFGAGMTGDEDHDAFDWKLGIETDQAPRHAIEGGVQQVFELADQGSLTARVDARYTHDQYVNVGKADPPAPFLLVSLPAHRNRR